MATEVVIRGVWPDDVERITQIEAECFPEAEAAGIEDFVARETGRKRIILTCKEHLVHYYESFGYVNGGVSGSTHGGAQWFDMTLIL